GNQSKKLTQDYFPIELTELPEDLREAFHTAARELASCGFTALGTVGHHVGGPVHNSFVSIWRNAARNDSAQVIGIRSRSPDEQIKVTTLVTFRTEFRDETSIVTSNSKSVGVFPRDPRSDGVSCPGFHDI